MSAIDDKGPNSFKDAGRDFSQLFKGMIDSSQYQLRRKLAVYSQPTVDPKFRELRL